MSAETEEPIGTSVLWKDWNSVNSEANYFISG